MFRGICAIHFDAVNHAKAVSTPHLFPSARSISSMMKPMKIEYLSCVDCRTFFHCVQQHECSKMQLGAILNHNARKRYTQLTKVLLFDTK
eukprot:322679-Amphidinium_carterae.1